MKKVLILSDTHSLIDAPILKYAKAHDEVWHAGDWGTIDVYDQLTELTPVKGVYGNIDGQTIRSENPKGRCFTVEGVKVLMTHIGGYPKRYNADFKERIVKEKPALVITGHSHILKVVYDHKLKHLHINPGAAGIHGFHKVRTMVSIEVAEGKISNAKVIELKK
ncbi:MAG: metallophosphoesterase family protein [Bacteroidetes bacterium]|nr:metallophosphoesterase family protein [Bacteroidota bacterium]